MQTTPVAHHKLHLNACTVPSPGNDADQGLFMGAQAIAGPAAQSLPVISVGSTDDTRITGPAVITFANNFTNITMGELQRTPTR